ncbi:hypothetical protein PUN28_001721 [Cardiocondyla obscurior]|uniref:Uncharacterized protein n=1 Tax=Cardiocondyla obscurior TaxID=286306 RepID=A0AAW2GQU6_9HYME
MSRRIFFANLKLIYGANFIHSRIILLLSLVTDYLNNFLHKTFIDVESVETTIAIRICEVHTIHALFYQCIYKNFKRHFMVNICEEFKLFFFKEVLNCNHNRLHIVDVCYSTRSNNISTYSTIHADLGKERKTLYSHTEPSRERFRDLDGVEIRLSFGNFHSKPLRPSVLLTLPFESKTNYKEGSALSRAARVKLIRCTVSVCGTTYSRVNFIHAVKLPWK